MNYLRYFAPWYKSVKIKGSNNYEAYENIEKWLNEYSEWSITNLGLFLRIEEESIVIVDELKNAGFTNIEKRGPNINLYSFEHKNVIKALDDINKSEKIFKRIKEWHLYLDIKFHVKKQNLLNIFEDTNFYVFESYFSISLSKFQSIDMEICIPVLDMSNISLLVNRIMETVPFSMGKKKFTIVHEDGKKETKEKVYL